MNEYLSMFPIGQCEMVDGHFAIRLMDEYREGLNGLVDFSHMIVLWWGHKADSAHMRKRLTIPSPYTASPDDFGVFSTRSQARPNPIGLSVCSITHVDLDKGLVFSHYFDMLPETPVLDLKPYFPASDRVMNTKVPDHFSHWPTSLEASAEFDWSEEFRA